MSDTRSLTIERALPHPPEKVWRALTTPHLIAEWLMPGDIKPEVGHEFHLSADWGGVDCKVLEADPPKRIVMTWVGKGLDSMVELTLTPTPTGTHLVMEQSGFTRDYPAAYGGARNGWARMFDTLETVLAKEP